MSLKYFTAHELETVKQMRSMLKPVRTLHAVGRELGLSHTMVNRIEMRALLKLRYRLKSSE